MLLFYGLYYGVLGRDFAEICADSMASHIGVDFINFVIFRLGLRINVESRNGLFKFFVYSIFILVTVVFLPLRPFFVLQYYIKNGLPKINYHDFNISENNNLHRFYFKKLKKKLPKINYHDFNISENEFTVILLKNII